MKDSVIDGSKILEVNTFIGVESQWYYWVEPKKKTFWSKGHNGGFRRLLDWEKTLHDALSIEGKKDDSGRIPTIEDNTVYYKPYVVIDMIGGTQKIVNFETPTEAIKYKDEIIKKYLPNALAI